MVIRPVAIAFLLCISTNSLAADIDVQQRFQFLCQWTKNAMPRAMESPLCADEQALKESANEQLLNVMEDYWSSWPAIDSTDSLRKSYDQAYRKRYPPPPPSASEFRTMPLEDVCRWWRTQKVAAALAELKRRGVFTAGELRPIQSGAIQIGMREPAMTCAVGEPTRRNRTVTANGIFVQHVYPNGVYVYTEDGVVTSWQD